jgi:hypothetical protein
MCRARAIQASLIPYAVALGGAPAHGAADFTVTVSLRAPLGCSAAVTRTGANGQPQVTLTCGSNLYVNVQPIVLVAPSGSSPIGATALTGRDLASPLSGDRAPPPSEMRDITGLMSTSDTRTSVSGRVFVQRRVTTSNSPALPTGAGPMRPAGEPTPGTASDLAGQPVEIWLIF